MKYNKILIAKNNPKNKCFSDENEWLVVAQSEDKMKGSLPDEHHFFVGVNSKKPSRYGWVATIDVGITSKELAEKYAENPEDELVARCELLLKAAGKQKDETPMACTFSIVGILEKKKVLKVHKVIFYKA